MNGKDFRIFLCGTVNQKDFLTIHKLVGRIIYMLQYKDLFVEYREGANPGFHEAVGDTISLSVMTPRHLEKLRLIWREENDFKIDINRLYQQALHDVALIPFAYVSDLYRWSIFRGDITEEVYNCEYWRLREKYQGIKPPIERTEVDFDAGSLFNIAHGIPYIKNFVSNIIKFQFYQALCKDAEQFVADNPTAKPIHKCDFQGNANAGHSLRHMMELGRKEHWPFAMRTLTDEREGKMDATPLMTYFDPLLKWLRFQNKLAGEYIGWISEDYDCDPSNYRESDEL